MKDNLYPLKFNAILKEKIWGGEKLAKLLNKNSERNDIGESWEISDVGEEASIVSNGILKGNSIKQLIRAYQNRLVGNKIYKKFGNKFPLLIKFIDAKKDLSIQLHPNDKLASSRHNSFGKTEMWYVMQADKDAELIIGFDGKIDKTTYVSHLNNGTLPSILNSEKVNVGDTFFIDVGRVHAIGAGVLLAEIQQTSDITYRLYDWDRKDAHGKSRELHTEMAMDAIDFNMKDDYKIKYDTGNNRVNDMVDCPYFTTKFLNISDSLKIENKHDSFHIYICVDGNVEFKNENFCERINKGETILMPADIKNFEISSKKSKLLQVYV